MDLSMDDASVFDEFDDSDNFEPVPIVSLSVSMRFIYTLLCPIAASNCIGTDSSAIEGQSKARTKEGYRAKSPKGHFKEAGTDYIEDHQARHEEASQARQR